jgi:hypothetical protein
MEVMISEETRLRHVRANHPSSSSRRVRAGRGAPGPSFSYRGSLTEPPCPNGLNDCSFPRNGVEELAVGAGVVAAGSLRLQPSEFIESRKDEEAMARGGRRALGPV